MPERWKFFRTFLRDRRVASVVPTAPSSVRRICQVLNFSRPLTLIELGPGNGAFTRYCSSRLTPDGRLLAVELNPQFSAVIRSLGDSRITVANDSAERLAAIIAERQFPPADAVISGIPFSFFSPERQQAIMRQARSALKPGGVFIVYQISPQVGGNLRRIFSRVEQFRVWRNLPPLTVYYANR